MAPEPKLLLRLMVEAETAAAAEAEVRAAAPRIEAFAAVEERKIATQDSGRRT